MSISQTYSLDKSLRYRNTQARNQLGTLGGAESFLRGPNFSTNSNSYPLCPTHFPGGANIFSGGIRLSLATVLGTPEV